MAVHTNVGGTLQYHTADEGVAADAWLTNWVAAHGALIRQDQSNGHSLSVIDPPTTEGCVSQLDVMYHLTTDTHEDAETLQTEIENAIYAAGTVAVADCDSSFGMTSD